MLCINASILLQVMMELNYQRVFNFTTKLAKQGMNHYPFEHKKTKRRLREDTYLGLMKQ